MKKLATNTGVLVLALIAVSGVSILLNLDTFYAPNDDLSKTSGGALLLSNVEVVKYDDAGNIVAYRQGANHIVDSGMEIIARQVFGPGANPQSGSPTNAAPTVSNNTNNTFGWGGLVQYMEIGNGTGASIPTTTATCGTGASGPGPVLGWNNKSLECPLSVSFNCARELAVIHRFNATEDPTPLNSDAAQINMTAVATFSGGANCAANNIGEAGIWTNATSDNINGGPIYGEPREGGNNMFARNTFGTVNLSTSDSLELTWKFTFTDS
jgi:hypothetical protein